MKNEKRKKVIETIKDNKAGSFMRLVRKKADDKDRYFVFMINDKTILNDSCYARQFRRIRELCRHAGLKNMLGLLYFSRENNLFDYNAIFDEINYIFDGVFTTNRYYSTKKYARIIDFEFKEDTDYILRWAAVYIASSIIRLMDIHFIIKKWDKLVRQKSVKRISNLTELLYYAHYYKVSGSNYCVNNTMFTLGLNAFDGTKTDRENFIKYIEEFLSNMKAYFGEGGYHERVSLNEYSFVRKYQQYITDKVYYLNEKLGMPKFEFSVEDLEAIDAK